MKANKLINEKSPYLLQHSRNPVDWYPWSNEAFELAKKEDKPVFLSIGYSSCHWCHIMERESFADDEVAELLNRVFVNVKVDREERPDIDAVYMSVCQALTGSGGWPLTIIMTPDKVPFFAGTYFPKYTIGNRIGLVDLVEKIDFIWKNRRNEIDSATQSLLNYLKEPSVSEEGLVFSGSYFDDVFNSLSFSYDKKFGGFGPSPKFPMPHNLLFLLEYYKRTKEPKSLEMVETTLIRMRLGGIFDQIGYGFHRYSTDAHWILPHFEKMLYDQALLMLAYCNGFITTKKEFYLQVADEIYQYLTENLLFEKSAFFSSEDADSENEEGKFYLFDYDELCSIIQEDFDLFCKVFNVAPDGNFVDYFHPERKLNILYLSELPEKLSKLFDVEFEELKRKIKLWSNLLKDYRSLRTRPSLDRKILTDWNGLTIAALSHFYKIKRDENVLSIIKNYFDFFQRYLFKPNGEVFHLYIDGEARIEGMLEDYAFTSFGFFEAFKSTGETSFLNLSYKLFAKALELFWDKENGGFFKAIIGKEDLIYNPKEFFDGAIPSGNSTMFYLLSVFDSVVFDETLKEIKERTKSLILAKAKEIPSLYNFFNFSLLHSEQVKGEIVVVYENEKDFENYKSIIDGKNLSDFLIVFYNLKKDFFDFEPLWKNYNLIDGRTTVYICKDFTCQAPITNFEEFVEKIESISNVE
ncbi:MAG: thioredoxin domain-containing protein [Ignavibacteria bacterium]|nr:thioredoxin domain-containing protein [Ignavibacteria bacterium]